MVVNGRQRITSSADMLYQPARVSGCGTGQKPQTLVPQYVAD